MAVTKHILFGSGNGARSLENHLNEEQGLLIQDISQRFVAQLYSACRDIFHWQNVLALHVLAYSLPAYRVPIFHLLIPFLPCNDELRHHLGDLFWAGSRWPFGYISSAKMAFYLCYYGVPFLGNHIIINLFMRIDASQYGKYRALPPTCIIWIVTFLLRQLFKQTQGLSRELNVTSIFTWALLLGHQIPIYGLLLMAIEGVFDAAVVSNLTVQSQYKRFLNRRTLQQALGTPITRPEAVKSNYEYLPLYSGEIRVLRVRRMPNKTTEYNLVIKHIESALDYTAVSYVWGSAAVTHGVLIDGKWLPTTASTFELLYHFPSWTTADEAYFWIDFVCINQNDTAEKRDQVKMMKDIYSRAICVIGYLKPNAPDDPDLAVELFRTLLNDFFFGIGDRSDWRGWFLKRTCVGFYLQLRSILTFLSAGMADLEWNWRWPGWQSLKGLVFHPFFSRIWIVQEVVLSKYLRFFYGDLEISWADIRTLAISDPRWDSMGPFRSNTWEAAKQKIRTSLQYRERYWNGTSLPFHELLSLARTMSASDPRDHVFAVQGLVAEYLDLPEDILPEYQLTKTEDLYTDVAKYFVNKGEVAWVLRMAGPGYSIENSLLPSWVPDWSSETPDTVTQIKSDDHQSRQKNMDRLTYGLFHNKLWLCSERVDRLKRIEPTWAILSTISNGNNKSRETIEYFSTMTSLLEFVSELPDKYPTGEDAMKALGATLTCGQQNDRIKALEIFFTDQLKVLPQFQKCVDFFKRIKELESPLWDSLKVIKEFTGAQVGLRSSEWPLESSLLDLQPRSLAITESGYFTLVPRYSRPGDWVYAFCEMESFFVLREHFPGDMVQDEYTLVGECYLHGIHLPEVSRQAMWDTGIVLV